MGGDRKESSPASVTERETTPAARRRVASTEFAPDGARKAKRGLDIAGALVLGVLFLPLVGVLACLLAIDLRGNPILIQRRIGFLGQTFALYKLRTMVSGAHGLRPRMIQAHGPSVGLFKLDNDPRATRLGRFLRRWSLDELPQFWNVLRGDMSLVGPRPLFPEDVEAVLRSEPGFRAWAEERKLVYPGITGLWQVSGRSTLSTVDLVRLDTAYVREWSLTRDLRLLARTPLAVFSRIGAF